MFVVFKSMRKKKTIKLQLKIKIGYLCRKFKFRQYSVAVRKWRKSKSLVTLEFYV